MWFSKKQVAKSPAGPANTPPDAPQLPAQGKPTTKKKGDDAEAAALACLRKAGLQLVEANYRTPGRGGGEIDLIMRAADGTLVFVEVRQRASASHGGAAASIGQVKQQRIVFAAGLFLTRFKSLPPCRFDVVLVQGRPSDPAGIQIEWLQAAFDAA